MWLIHGLECISDKKNSGRKRGNWEKRERDEKESPCPQWRCCPPWQAGNEHRGSKMFCMQEGRGGGALRLSSTFSSVRFQPSVKRDTHEPYWGSLKIQPGSSPGRLSRHFYWSFTPLWCLWSFPGSISTKSPTVFVDREHLIGWKRSKGPWSLGMSSPRSGSIWLFPHWYYPHIDAWGFIQSKAITRKEIRKMLQKESYVAYHTEVNGTGSLWRIAYTREPFWRQLAFRKGQLPHRRYFYVALRTAAALTSTKADEGNNLHKRISKC